MPRISRFAVEFTIPNDNKVWLAEFVHRHATTECKHGTCLRPQCSHYDGKCRPQHVTVEDCPQPRMRGVCPFKHVTPIQHRVDSGPDVGKMINVQHVTTIKLRHKGS